MANLLHTTFPVGLLVLKENVYVTLTAVGFSFFRFFSPGEESHLLVALSKVLTGLQYEKKEEAAREYKIS